MAAPALAPLAAFASSLLAWYQSARRDLPWRHTRDPYRVWISEIMLQQTRVAAVIPYYERFLARFPDVAALALAPEQDVLAAWSGLGYYSRARNLQKAARILLECGQFPSTYEEIRQLPGIGDYTAAAIASISFALPHVVVDGNVLRVMSRYAAEPGDIAASATRARLRVLAQSLLDPARAADFNQALMELGAIVCLPREPQCPLCPVSTGCAAKALQRQRGFPVKARKQRGVAVEKTVLIVEQNGSLLLWQRPGDSTRMAGFWELPDASQLPGADFGPCLGEVRHGIAVNSYRIRVCRAQAGVVPNGFVWIAKSNLPHLPLSTIARKALASVE